MSNTNSIEEATMQSGSTDTELGSNDFGMNDFGEGEREFEHAYGVVYFSVLVFDVSGSIGSGIRSIEEGYAQYVELLRTQGALAKDARIAVVTFNHEAQVAIPWTFVTEAPQQINLGRASGGTDVGKAMKLALELVQDHRDRIGLQAHYKPVIILVTDSDGSAPYQEVAAEVREMQKPWVDETGKQRQPRLVVHPAAVNGGKKDIAAAFHPQGAVWDFKLEHLNKFLTFIVSSLTASIASHSAPAGETVALPSMPAELNISYLTQSPFGD